MDCVRARIAFALWVSYADHHQSDGGGGGGDADGNHIRIPLGFASTTWIGAYICFLFWLDVSRFCFGG